MSSLTTRQFYSLQRILKSGFLNLFRNAWLTIAATAVMVVALVIIFLSIVLNVTANNAIDTLAKDLKASIYLADDVSDGTIANMRTAVEQLDFVESVEFIDKNRAQADLANDFNNDSDILQALSLAGDDVLPASLRITVTDLARMPEIQTFADNSEYNAFIDSISLGQTDAQATIDKAASAQRFITTSSIIAATTLAAVSVMIIFNTIRMAIYTRRDEIRIMKLIGATPNYIRGPFLVEASLYGVFAGIIANILVYMLIYSLGGNVSNQPEFSQTYAFFTQTDTMIMMGFGAVLVGILIGAISSMMAMGKHLKLKHW